MNRLIIGLLMLACGAAWAPAGIAASGRDAVPTVAIPYLSGGIGADERQQLRDRREEFNLRLCFAAKVSGSYLADVKVSIAKPGGEPVLRLESAGPWLYASLPPGKYRVTAESNGQQLTRVVSVAAGRPTVAFLYWP